MRIRRAEVFLLSIPLRIEVRHALAVRAVTRNVLVRLEDERGLEGWGEGVPRRYVTGETPEGAFRLLETSLLPGLLSFDASSPGEVPGAVGRCLPLGEGSQAARCAAELALLDLAGRRFGLSALAWLGAPRRRAFRYGVVVPILDARGRRALLESIAGEGIAHVKVKAEGEGEGLLDTMRAARNILGGEVSLCVDANGSWDARRAPAVVGGLEPFAPRWVEQPLARGMEEETRRLAAATSIPFMADESLTTPGEARRLASAGGFRLFNLRVSKLGGLIPSFQAAREAGDAGIGVQVGCQVGETAVLAAAGRLLAAAVPSLEAVEGSYGERLLESDVAEGPFQFGRGGAALLQEGPGLGVTVLRRRLDPLVTASSSLGA